MAKVLIDYLQVIKDQLGSTAIVTPGGDEYGGQGGVYYYAVEVEGDEYMVRVTNSINHPTKFEFYLKEPHLTIVPKLNR